MKIGIGSGAYWNDDDVNAGLEIMKKHGFECMDYQKFTDTDGNILFKCSDDEFETMVKQDAEAIAAAGIEVSQTHGPWRYPPKDATEEDRQERFEKMSRALHGTRLLGCKYMVLHPIMPFGPDNEGDRDEFMRINIEFFTGLCKVAEREQVIICLENMPMLKLPVATPSQILEFVEKINSPYLEICLDTGHATVHKVSAGDAVRISGEHLRVLHVHDNNGRADQHLMPFYGVTDWADFSNALRETGFEGVLSLECSVGKNLPEEIKEYHQKGLYMIAKALI